MTKSFLRTFILFCFLTSCTWIKGPISSDKSDKSEKEAAPTQTSVATSNGSESLAPKDQQLLRLSRYLEQADAVHREAWWVVAADRKPPGKTLFGKVQRGLAQELKLKLKNKSLFSCDRYLVKRDILFPSGLPQKGTVFENCNSRSGAVPLAEYNLKSKTQAEVIFQGQNLGDVLGLGTAILNKYIRCEFNGDEEGRLTDLVCADLSQDRNATQSLRFTTYEYHRSGQSLLKLRGQVIEALYPIRKFQADVPLEGKIQVVETQTEAPEGMKPTPAPTLRPSPTLTQEAPAEPVIVPTAQKLDPDAIRRHQIEGGAIQDQPMDEHEDPMREIGPSVRGGSGEIMAPAPPPAPGEEPDNNLLQAPVGPPAPPLAPSQR